MTVMCSCSDCCRLRSMCCLKRSGLLTEISQYFRELTSTTLNVQILMQMEKDIPIFLCKLKQFFPPGFFDSMEHLPVHLAYEARICGPVQYRWMYPFERFLKTLKDKVKNKAHVKASNVMHIC